MAGTIYDIDYEKFALRMLPPDKRFTNMLAWIKVLLSPLAYLRDLILNDYRIGSEAVLWVEGNTYSKYDQVKYKSIVYESIIDNNESVPTDQSAWRVVLDNFIGVEERVLYSGNKLIFEYAINKYFGTTFRQPGETSDIYIEAQEKPNSVFITGGDEPNSSVVYTDRSSEVVINEYLFADYSNMVINVPESVFNTLDTDLANCEKIVRNFANKYIIAGVTFTISTY